MLDHIPSMEYIHMEQQVLHVQLVVIQDTYREQHQPDYFLKEAPSHYSAQIIVLEIVKFHDLHFSA